MQSSRGPVPRFAALLLTTVLAAVAAGPVRAQSLAIEPVTVHLAPGQIAETLTVTNQTGEATSFQVRAFAWSAPQGADQLVPTDAIILSPPLGTIAPGAQQLIRLVLRQPPRDKEATYRIWLDQIPAPAAPGAVRIALRLSIPVFAEPPARALPDLDWRLENVGGQVSLLVSNTGARHQTVRNLRLTSSDGTALRVEGAASPYILPGESRRWQVLFPGNVPATGSTLHLTADTEDGRLDRTVALDASGP